MIAPKRALSFACVAAFAVLASACSTTNHFNPFDGDPNGPPELNLWSDAYGGADASPRASVRHEDARVARDVTPPSGRASYDRSYGTSAVELDPLPAPSSQPTRADDLRPDERYPVAANDGGGRTLHTGRAGAAEEAAPPPAERATIHRVRAGEEVADIADRYGVREVDIIRANGLQPPYRLVAGAELRIPGAQTAAAPAAPPAPRPADPKPVTKPAEDPSGMPRFDWPVSGQVIAGFGATKDGLYNEGINIAVPEGTPVRAAAPGVVRYAGNELRGYGNLVLIEHTGGFITAYAHNQTLTVKRDDKIARGDVIARSGKTGNVKSPQLHFEIRKGTKSVDPSQYLVATN